MLTVNILNIVNYAVTKKYEIDEARSSTINIDVNNRKDEIERIINYLLTSSILSVISISILVFILISQRKK